MTIMTFNGNVLPIKVISVGGRGPASQEVIRQSSLSDGSIFIKRRRTEKVLPIEYSIIHNGIEELRDKVDELDLLIDTEKPAEIVFSDEPEYTYYGIIEGDQDTSEGHYKSYGVLSFLRLDPFKYKAEVTQDLNANNVVTLSSKEALPIFDITVNSITPEFVINHQESGGTVKIIYDFIETDRITLDLAKRKVLINDKVNMPTYSFDNIPFKFKRGSNTLTFTDGAIVSVRYRPRM